MRKVEVERAARRRTDVPKAILDSLNQGKSETRNLMEWLSVDMATLAEQTARTATTQRVRAALLRCARSVPSAGVTLKLRYFGDQLARVMQEEQLAFEELSAHKSDIVRQWACYAINSPELGIGRETRLSLTRRFAADPNMSVREAAWMAYRPYVVQDLTESLARLKPFVEETNASLRRFAIEVSRPRSVWGRHCEELKRNPQIAEPLLDHVKSDRSRYVQLAVGNWLNDASKTRPDWVIDICHRWQGIHTRETLNIVRRGTRTIRRLQGA